MQMKKKPTSKTRTHNIKQNLKSYNNNLRFLIYYVTLNKTKLDVTHIDNKII